MTTIIVLYIVDNMNWEEQKKQFKERRQEIYQKHKIEKMSYNKIARMYDITPSRVGIIVQKEKKYDPEITQE